MTRQRHYVNPKDPGVPCFVTTTVLDFVHACHRPEARDRMAFSLAGSCKLQRATLYAYVVMPHHIHLIVRPRPDQTISAFMERFKPFTSAAVSRILSKAELSQFDQRRGLNGNTFWQRGFRAIEIEGERMLQQKLDYVHENPVRARYVERPEDYRWSSARLIARGLWSEDLGLPYNEVEESLNVSPADCDASAACGGCSLSRPGRMRLHPRRPLARTSASIQNQSAAGDLAGGDWLHHHRMVRLVVPEEGGSNA